MGNKKLTARQIIVNRLYSDLSEYVLEIEYGHKEYEAYAIEDLFSFFSRILQSAGVDSDIIVEVLEMFGEEGKKEALTIKINEGW